MPWDQIFVALIVLAAAVYLVRRNLRRRSSCGDCGSGCGDGATRKTRAPSHDLIQLELRPAPRRDVEDLASRN